MAVFITGGNGHVGSWIAYVFAKNNKNVIIYDIKNKYLEYLEEYKDKITFIEGDVLDFARLTNVINKYKNDIEGIVHTVAIMGEFVSLNPFHNIFLNTFGLLNVLEIARIFNIKKIVFTSTGAVYGLKKGKAKEEDSINPQDLYAASKASAEIIGIQYAKNYDLDFRIGRLYFVYGPGKLPSSFLTLYKLAFGVLEGIKNLQSSKGGEQKIDFTYVLDAAQGIYLLYEKKNASSGVYNISSGKSYEINQVIKTGEKYTHFPVKICLGKGILMNRVEKLDITKAKKDLGYNPQFSIDIGIKLYSDWIKKIKQVK